MQSLRMLEQRGRGVRQEQEKERKRNGIVRRKTKKKIEKELVWREWKKGFPDWRKKPDGELEDMEAASPFSLASANQFFSTLSLSNSTQQWKHDRFFSSQQKERGRDLLNCWLIYVLIFYIHAIKLSIHYQNIYIYIYFN